MSKPIPQGGKRCSWCGAEEGSGGCEECRLSQTHEAPAMTPKQAYDKWEAVRAEMLKLQRALRPILKAAEEAEAAAWAEYQATQSHGVGNEREGYPCQ